MNGDPTTIARTLFAALERAWNDADGAGFAAPFTDDADFVDIRGAHHSGRAALALGHQAIFDSIYKGSTVRYAVTDAAVIAPGCVVAHVAGSLDAPSGPLAGEHDAVSTAVAIERDGAWQIVAFHNTLVTG